MRNSKNIFFVSLFFLSIAVVLFGGWKFMDIPPAHAYVDAGVRDFIPTQVFPTQVKNTSGSSRDRRMHPTKTVYKLTYRATDGSGYQWSTEVTAKSIGKQMLAEGKIESRRVLKLPQEKTFVPVQPNQDAQSYTKSLQKRHLLLIAPFAAYIVIYIIVSIFLFFRKHV